jgi:hypothetical protein
MGNFRGGGWRGQLRGVHFDSFALDEPDFVTAARYVELNRVLGVDEGAKSLWMEQCRRLSASPGRHPGAGWPSARQGRQVATFAGVIREHDIKRLHAHELTGRPPGDEAFPVKLKQGLGRIE